MKFLILIQTERLNGQMEHSSWAAGLENERRKKKGSAFNSKKLLCH